MIQKISVENYKSIKMLADFELKPVNILIGANNSGKSNFLDVFAFLRDTLSDPKSNGQIDQKNKGWKGALHRRGGIASVSHQKERQS